LEVQIKRMRACSGFNSSKSAKKKKVGLSLANGAVTELRVHAPHPGSLRLTSSRCMADVSEIRRLCPSARAALSPHTNRHSGRDGSAQPWLPFDRVPPGLGRELRSFTSGSRARSVSLAFDPELFQRI
jgi:hypothetical protein